jgi:hypothetical protein
MPFVEPQPETTSIVFIRGQGNHAKGGQGNLAGTLWRQWSMNTVLELFRGLCFVFFFVFEFGSSDKVILDAINPHRDHVLYIVS